jgi:hypothetical protein
MPSQMPPVPPASRSPKGPGANPKVSKKSEPPQEPAENLDQQGRHGNIKQNTTNQGYQQDR